MISARPYLPDEFDGSREEPALLAIYCGLNHLGPVTADLNAQHDDEHKRWVHMIDLYRSSRARRRDPLMSFADLYQHVRDELRAMVRATGPGSMTEDRAHVLGQLSLAMFLLRAESEMQAQQHDEPDERPRDVRNRDIKRHGGGFDV